MKQVMVRYRVQPEKAAQNEALVQAVFAELERTRPTGVRYAAYVLDDGVNYIHLATHDGDGPNPIIATGAFAAYVAGIGERCVEPPVAGEFREIGSYGLRG